jgi:uncharacterized Zn finger protein
MAVNRSVRLSTGASASVTRTSGASASDPSVSKPSVSKPSVSKPSVPTPSASTSIAPTSSASTPITPELTGPGQGNRQWWAEQWLALLDSYRFKKRLERGWTYARQGNVLRIDFADRKVVSLVQGTEVKPYNVSLWLDELTDEDWDYVVNTMSDRAIFSAKLLSGEMPMHIEEVFSANGLRLFPFSLSDIHSDCSCPDKANPCKHISAVFYMLGDRFGDDPFVLFQLRGRTRRQVLDALRQKRSSQQSRPEKPVSEPLQLQQFWQYDEPLDSGLVVIAPPIEPETVLDSLGPVPIDGNELQRIAVDEHFRSLYQTVSQMAMLQAITADNARSDGG